MTQHRKSAPEMAARLGTDEYRVRLEWAHAAWGALDLCAPQDRAVVLADHLARLETSGPVLGDLLGTVTADALFWADVAPVHELTAYGVAALDRLRGLPLGLTARKKLFMDLWRSFGPADRCAFLKRIDDGGRFQRRGSA